MANWLTKYPSYQELIRKIDDQPKTNNNYFNQPSEDVLEENEEHLSNYQITQNELENIDLIGKGIVITGNFSIEREEIKNFSNENWWTNKIRNNR